MARNTVLRIALAVTALGIILAAAPGVASGASLVGHWALDGDATDSGPGKSNGTVNGNVAFIPGMFAQAAQFDGAGDYILIPSNTGIQLRGGTGEYSVAVWVKPDDTGDHLILLQGLGCSTWGSWFLGLGGPEPDATRYPNMLVFGVRSTGAAAYTGVMADAVAGEWVHVAASYDGAVLTLYLDGQEQQSIETNTMPGANTDGFYIGGDPGCNGRVWYAGLVDDLYIYNRALEPAQVQGLMEGIPAAFTKAVRPTPEDGATGVGAPMLQWTPGETAIFVDVFVGTTPDLTAANRLKRQPAAIKMLYVVVPPLEPGQTYFWRVDAVDAKGALISTGDVWSFTMAPVTAFAPIPADGALYQSVDAVLSWTPGQNAFSHELYFSTSQDDVANRAEAAFQGSLVETALALPPLSLETKFYWAVDEIDALGDKQAGDVWSFTTTIPGLGFAKRELWLNGSSGTTVADLTNDPRYPGSPSDVNEVSDFESPADVADNYGGKLSAWLHVPLAGEYTFWIASDDNSELWLGADADSAERIASVPDWTSAQEWDKFASQKSKPVALEAGRYYLMALWKDGTGGDNCAVAWQGAGIPNRELIAGSYLMPFEALWAYGPRPRNGAVDTPQTLELKWTAGTRGTTHQVYFSEDKDAVVNGEPGSAAYRGQQAVDDTTFDPGALEFGKTFYWRVDEVNPTEADSPWKGAVWSFTTANFIVVDDFEDYVDDVEGRIFQTWIDGWGYTEPAPGNPGNGTGSAVGYGAAPFAERTIVKSGLQSMPLAYNNADSPFYSETNRTFDTPMNWTVNGMDTLSLQVYGYPELTTTAVTETGGKMTLAGGGRDIWDNSDEFTYAFKSLNGDGSIVARVVSVGAGSNTWAKGGVMIRDSLDGGSMHAMMVMTDGGGNGASFQYRNATDGTSGNTDSSVIVTPPYWVRLERFGDSFAGYTSADGATWVNVGAQDVVMTAPVYIGLCVTSHVAGTDRTFEFDNIKTTGSVTGQWQGAVIASPKYNSTQDLYVVVTDSANKSATVTNATAVNATDWTEVLMPLSSFTGVSMTKVKSMTIGVGSRTSPMADGTGMLFIDDIRVIKP
ncbi:MAG: hypothetical protein JW955_04465 [Sedimentisphaerales bacterium]|nr:hypothetical protein [Sedimentisphaerales bacterium]